MGYPQRSQIGHRGYKFGLWGHFKRKPKDFHTGDQKCRERGYFSILERAPVIPTDPPIVNHREDAPILPSTLQISHDIW